MSPLWTDGRTDGRRKCEYSARIREAGFAKIFCLCGLKGHIVEIRRDVTLVHGGRTTDDGRNVKI